MVNEPIIIWLLVLICEPLADDIDTLTHRMETLKRHLSFSGEEGLLELKKIAVRFEEGMYCAATSRSDYLRNISLKMPKMETKSQNPMDPIPLQPNDASNSENPQDSGGKNE